MSRLDGAVPGDAPSSTSTLRREPIVVGNLVGVLILNLCGLLQEFGVPLSEGQQEAITRVVGTLLLLGTALLARRFVTPLARPRDSQGRPLQARPRFRPQRGAGETPGRP